MTSEMKALGMAIQITTCRGGAYSGGRTTCLKRCYATAPRVWASDDARLTSDVCLSRTSGLGREAYRKTKIGTEVAIMIRTPFSTSKGQRSNCRGRSILWWLPHSLLCLRPVMPPASWR